ncbi:peptidyl-prolyl cis-trans isomerase CWC27 homolog [Trichogramma pretiosum]|uniref:peptidyl-prolyl cis-trans isomerase CWC27 homolog n=1 Tax=Trichogramma pretiosum TaxID=7493 RepID=UPI0006C9B4D6|nr:peptidyl-prolyl cis-trans isomerase CWC27 homolog [Trichogramma pretiosum]
MSNIYIQEPPTSGKVVMKTSVGDIDIELWAKETPKACRNFIQLCMEGYYDGTLFHRIVKGFIAQGGDPTGTGEGGESIYGEPFKDEFHTRLRFVRRGLVAMANAGKDDNGSQFFFTLAATPELQNKHTIFGKVTGETIYNMIKLEDALVDVNDRPQYPQKIIKTEILNNPFDDIVPRTVPKKKTDEGKKKKKKKGVKDFKLLSFGEEAEEEEEMSIELSKKFSTKSKSAHDILSDPKLSSEPILADDEPASKKFKESDDVDGSSDEKSDNEDNVKLKETKDMTDRIREKLKSSSKKTAEVKKTIQKPELEKNDEESEEEYYFGKERDDERKKEIAKIKKEYREIKRQMRDEDNKKLEIEKKKEDKKNKKVSNSEMVQEFHKTQEEYKERLSKIPKKGVSREDFTLDILKKFQSKINEAKEKLGEEASSSKEKTDDDDDDLNSDSLLAHTLQCEEKNPVLAKDASTKNDDWFEIYDPRNPLNKRRRGEKERSKKK